MKKITTLMAVALSAIAVNAATATWTVAGVKTYSDASVNASGYAAYLFFSASTVSTDNVVAIADVIASISEGTFTSDYASKAIQTGVTGTAGNYTKTGIGNYGADDSVTAYTIIFDASTVDAASNYAIVSDVTATWTSSVGAKPLAFTNFSTNAGTWNAVPEPTSGLLLLLGMASLALKRKIA